MAMHPVVESVKGLFSSWGFCWICLFFCTPVYSCFYVIVLLYVFVSFEFYLCALLLFTWMLCLCIVPLSPVSAGSLVIKVMRLLQERYFHLRPGEVLTFICMYAYVCIPWKTKCIYSMWLTPPNHIQILGEYKLLDLTSVTGTRWSAPMAQLLFHCHGSQVSVLMSNSLSALIMSYIMRSDEYRKYDSSTFFLKMYPCKSSSGWFSTALFHIGSKHDPAPNLWNWPETFDPACKVTSSCNLETHTVCFEWKISPSMQCFLHCFWCPWLSLFFASRDAVTSSPLLTSPSLSVIRKLTLLTGWSCVFSLR